MSDAKMEQLKKLSEKDFRENVLIPLLKKMGFERVRHRHGSDEYGKDITFCTPTPINVIYYAVVAKVGDISGAADARDNLTKTLSTIKEQVDQAFRMPIEDATENNAASKEVNQVIVWTNGKISGHAEEQIVKKLDTRYRNVEFRDGQMTLDYLEKYYPEFFTIGDANVSTYFNNAKSHYSQLLELYTLGKFSAPKRLPAIFVAPTLQRVMWKRSKQARKENLPLPTISYSKLLRDKRRCLIIGDMGAGKTTLLRRMLIDIIEENEKTLQKYPIPILINFKRLNLEDDCAIEQAAAEEFSRQTLDQNSIDLKDLFSNGDIFLLLDGLDELQTEEDIDKGIGLVRDFASRYTSTRIVISSRNLDIFRATNPLAGFFAFRIRHFDLKQMCEFVTKWFGGESSECKELVNLVSEPITYSMIVSTPLTLALVAVLYESGFRELPANLTELFEQYTELALGRWDIGKDLSSSVEWRIKQLILREIAWAMQNQKELEISPIEICACIEKTKTDKGLVLDTEKLLSELTERSGLLTRKANQLYEFKHRAFQDFFAGAKLDSLPQAIEITKEYFMQSWWIWTLFFACGTRRESTEYLRAAIESIVIPEGGHFHYALELGLLAQAAYLANQSSKKNAVRASLISLVESWDETVKGLEDLEAKLPLEMKHHISHTTILSVYCDTIDLIIGSRTLRAAIATLCDDLLGDQTEENVFPHNPKMREWYAFFLAIACLEVEEIGKFTELYEKRIVSDPLFCEMGILGMEIFEKKGTPTTAEKEAMKSLKKYLGRRSVKGKPLLARLGDSKPLLLGSHIDDDTNADSE